MKAPNYSVHNFACPDCKLNCQLIQDGRRASMRHQRPSCKTYEATKKDGQKFLELAFIAVPAEEPDPVLVAFRDSGQKLEADESPDEALAEAAPQVSAPTPDYAAALAEAQPKVSTLTAAELAELAKQAPTPAPVHRCTCLVGEEGTGQHARNCPWSFMRAEPPAPAPRRRAASPPRWQPLLEQLASELRAQVYERGEHSRGLAQAMADATPGDTLVGFDDNKIAGVAQAIVAICAGSKGHP